MPTFKYRAVDGNGKSLSGRIFARDFQDAKTRIGANGFIPTKVVEETEFKQVLNRLTVRKLSIKNISVFCRQLFIIINSGVNILAGLAVLKKQVKNKELKVVVERIHNEVQRGRSLSEAMADVEGVLPPLLINMISVGEISGNLPDILKRLSSYYEKESHIKEKIKGAMIYPFILIIIAVVMLVFFANFVLPEILNVITEIGGELPGITQAIISTVFFFKRNMISVLFGMVGVIILLFVLSRRKTFKDLKDKALMKIPVLSTSIRNVVTARFVRTMSIILKSGIPLVQALESTRPVVGNAVLEECMKSAIEGIKRGEKLGVNIASCDFFDPLVIHMIDMGEEMGELDNILETMADYYDNEADTWIAKMMSAIEPLFTIVVGLFIGGIIVSLMIPMFGMLSQLNR